MGKTELRLPDILNRLRWIIPAMLAAFGAGYTLFDHLWMTSAPISEVHVLREVFVIGIVAPTLTALILTWATGIARSRQQLIKSLKQHALQIEAASQVSQKVTAILDMNELMAQIVQLILEKFDYYGVHLFLVDGHSNEIVLRECSGKASGPLKAQGVRLKIGEQGITGQVAQTGEPILCNDILQTPSYHHHELLPETRAELAIPLRIGDIVLGVLDVQSTQPDAFHEDDITTLQMLGDQIAIALENANLFRETQHRYEIMRALHEISVEITAHLNSAQVLSKILERATRLLRSQGSAFHVCDLEEGVLRQVAGYNVPSEYVEGGVTLKLGEGVAGQIVANGKPLIVNDFRNWSGYTPIFKQSPYNAIIGVPMRSQGQVIGTLIVLNEAGYRPFTEEDVRVLNLFAEMASIALKNAGLFTQVVQSNSQLEEMVKERTRDLVAAREEIARKAEQLQQLLDKVMHVQEEERSRIALDLHDGSNQLITGTLFEIQAAEQCVLNQRDLHALEKLETAKALLRQIEAENRRIITGLRPPILDAQGLAATLEWYAANCKKRFGIACTTRVSGEPTRLLPETEISVYRIVQEALNNVMAHAQAQKVQIRLEFSPSRLRVVVEDNGVGFVVDEVQTTATDHVGLFGMRKRAQSIDSHIEIDSAPGGGTRIVLDVPLSTELALETLSV